MELAMFVIAMSLIAALIVFGCAMCIDYFGHVDMELAGFISSGTVCVLGITLAVLAIINWGLSLA